MSIASDFVLNSLFYWMKLELQNCERTKEKYYINDHWTNHITYLLSRLNIKKLSLYFLNKSVLCHLLFCSRHPSYLNLIVKMCMLLSEKYTKRLMAQKKAHKFFIKTVLNMNLLKKKCELFVCSMCSLICLCSIWCTLTKVLLIWSLHLMHLPLHVQI